MSKKLEYAILRYTPMLIAGESVNIGVLFSSDGFQSFRSIKKFSRIKYFDDELDINSLKFLFSAIENDLKPLKLNGPFNIHDFTKYYMNEFNFSEPMKIAYDKLDDTIESIVKFYLKYDFEKNNRLSNKEQEKLIEKVLEVNHESYRKNQQITGRFNDTITYDITFKNYGIKFFDFKGKEISKMINTIKAWAWNCENSPQNIKSIIIYSKDINKDPQYDDRFQTCIDILKDSSDEIYDIENGLNKIHSLLIR